MLDDSKRIAEIDKSSMLDFITNFPKQIQDAMEIARASEIPKFIKINDIIVTGMGASGISGDIIKCLFRDKVDVPIFVNRDYGLPKWAHKDTLTVFLSYSGNTEETISAFKSACQKRCNIICIASGGKLKELCEKQEVPCITIPPGFQPRAAVAFLLFPVLTILKHNGLVKDTIDADIEEAISITTDVSTSNKKSIPEKDNRSKQIAHQLYQTIPQMYGWDIYYPIAIRWQTQFNENSKLIARADIVPECNHNDIVGWSYNPEVSKQFSCILFRDKDLETHNMSIRLDFMKTLLKSTAQNVIELSPRGKSRLAKMIYLMCLGDFISSYLAVLRNIDPTPIEAIIELKNRLAEK